MDTSREVYLYRATIGLGHFDASITKWYMCQLYSIFMNNAYFKRAVYPYQATIEIGGFDASILNDILVNYTIFISI